MLKLLLAAALVAVPCSVAPAIPQPLDPAIAPKVVCPVFAGPVLLGWSMGTAFRVGHGLLLSVKHVTHYDQCFIAGKQINTTYEGPKQDFSIISDGQDGPFLKIDCGGFHKGGHYHAWGHARGRDELTVIGLEGTGKKDSGYAVLTGIYTVIPGQSGGPITDDETGRVVGTVNAYDMAGGLSYSIALADTPICGAKA